MPKTLRRLLMWLLPEPPPYRLHRVEMRMPGVKFTPVDHDEEEIDTRPIRIPA